KNCIHIGHPSPQGNDFAMKKSPEKINLTQQQILFFLGSLGEVVKILQCQVAPAYSTPAGVPNSGVPVVFVRSVAIGLPVVPKDRGWAGPDDGHIIPFGGPVGIGSAGARDYIPSHVEIIP